MEICRLSIFTAVLLIYNVIGSRLTEKRIEKKVKHDMLRSSSYAEMYNKFMSYYDDVFDEDERRLIQRGAAAGWSGATGTLARSIQVKKQRNIIKSVKMIKKHNKNFLRGSSSYELELNSFALMDYDEQLRFTGLQNSSMMAQIPEDNLNHYGGFSRTGTFGDDSPTYVGYSGDAYGGYRENLGGYGENLGASTPKSFDWRKKGYVTSVKNQESCSSCWAFSIVVVLEANLKKATSRLVSLSPQELVDCVYRNKDTCQTGGFFDEPLNYLRRSGRISGWKDYRYRNRQSSCMARKYKNVLAREMKYTGVRKISTQNERSEKALVSALFNISPIMVAVSATNEFFKAGRGIFNGCRRQENVNHAVTITGYTSTYFDVKNSWGDDWGMDGFYKSRRGRSVCRILLYPHYYTFVDLNKANGDKDHTDDEDSSIEGTVVIPTNCEDKKNKCSSLRQHCGKESDRSQLQYMMTYCKKTCRNCTCIDTAPAAKCVRFKEAGYCTDYADYMNYYCPVTCGFCRKCRPGFISEARGCVQCPAKTYHDMMSNTCAKCPPGTNSKPGARSKVDCRKQGGGGGRCSGGLMFCAATGQCTHQHFCKG